MWGISVIEYFHRTLSQDVLRCINYIIIISSTILPSSSSEGVFWELSSHPAVFGTDVILLCNASGVAGCCTTELRRWNGGPDQVLLSVNEKSFYPKYTSTTEPDGFNLVIHNFTERDINVIYTCSYGLKQYKNVLNLDDKFEILLIFVVGILIY